MRQPAPAEVQQLEHLVEARGVAPPGRNDREDPLEITRDEVALEQRLAGPHPVAVPLHRVDLAVVRDVAVRVSERPRRERVRAVPGVHESDRGLDALIDDVEEELGELRRGQHPLVDEGAAREAREVHRPSDLVLDPLAHDEREPFQAHPVDRTQGGADEQLAKQGHDFARARADHRVVDRDVAPAEDPEALTPDDLLDEGDDLLGVGLRGRQERDARRVLTGGGQVEVDDLPEESVGHLDRDAGAVAGVRLGPLGAPVLEVAERSDAHGDDLVTGPTLDVDDERDAAGVVLIRGVVQAERGRKVGRPGGAQLRSHVSRHHCPSTSLVWVTQQVGTALARAAGVFRIVQSAGGIAEFPGPKARRAFLGKYASPMTRKRPQSAGAFRDQSLKTGSRFSK